MISLRSEITKKLLNYLFMNPHDSFYVNELSRKLGLDKRNLVKKIRELEKEGILGKQSRGNLTFYSLNTKYPLYQEYKKIILKTIGFEEELKKILKEVDGIHEGYIYGSYAQNKLDVHSDIDLLVVGNHDIVLLQRTLNRLQKEIDREINVFNIDPEEFKKRMRRRDPFIQEILKGHHIRIT